MSVEYWWSKGVTTRTANALTNHGVDSIERVQELGSLGIGMIPGIGTVALQQIHKLARWPPPEKGWRSRTRSSDA